MGTIQHTLIKQSGFVEEHPYLSAGGSLAALGGVIAAAALLRGKGGSKVVKRVAGKTPKTPKVPNMARVDALIRRIAHKKKTSDVFFLALTDELEKIGTAIIRDPEDKLDRRTTRAHRKPNPRILPAPMPSGKLVT